MLSQEAPFNERPETVAFVWPAGQPAPDEVALQTYAVDSYIDRASFEAVQMAIGWRVSEEQWGLLSEQLVPTSMVFMMLNDNPVGVACALSRDANWVELAWVAVVPAHQGRGIGRILCAAVVRQVLSLGTYQIFGSTQDERLAALKIYLDIGFHPVCRPEKTKRWQSIFQQLNLPFTPLLWGWSSPNCT